MLWSTVLCSEKVIQKAVKEERFKSAENEMAMITDPFPIARINMVSFSRDSLSGSPSKKWK